MKSAFPRKPRTYDPERDRLLNRLKTLDPVGDEYPKVMAQLDHLDKIRNRTSELTKTVIPAIGTVAGVGGIYALQQFGGVIVPKALDMLATMRPSQKPRKDD